MLGVWPGRGWWLCLRAGGLGVRLNDGPDIKLFILVGLGRRFFCLLSVAWLTGIQLLVLFCSSVPVVLFGARGVSGCRSRRVSVESSSLLHRSVYL